MILWNFSVSQMYNTGFRYVYFHNGFNKLLKLLRVLIFCNNAKHKEAPYTPLYSYKIFLWFQTVEHKHQIDCIPKHYFDKICAKNILLIIFKGTRFYFPYIAT